jgi:hypothetical protein
VLQPTRRYCNTVSSGGESRSLLGISRQAFSVHARAWVEAGKVVRTGTALGVHALSSLLKIAVAAMISTCRRKPASSKALIRVKRVF